MVDRLYMDAKAWPFEQARRILQRLEAEKQRGYDRANRPVLFETGYGPSGLPHIGTFGEVARTTMVRQAFIALTEGQIPTRLIVFSDDMDGLRKLPDNIPNADKIAAHLGKPLSDVPDPFGCHDSYAAHNNALLREFLDGFDFDYEFCTATEMYKSGQFDEMLLRILIQYQPIMDTMLPTLRAERQASYSPFLPISPSSGRVLYVPMTDVDSRQGTISFMDEDGQPVTLPVTGGQVKIQWKPDFGMRWAELGVDFEMFGKDHQANAVVYSKICRLLGASPPVQYVYELFLDDVGKKISKSKGNGISVEDWLHYGTPESLAFYMFQKPRTAKRLFFDVIPKAIDEYLQNLSAFGTQAPQARVENPVWHIHNSVPPNESVSVSFGLLISLVSSANASDESILWGFINRYEPDLTPQNSPLLNRLVSCAMRYYEAFVRPHKHYRMPNVQEQAALADLAVRLRQVPPEVCADAQELQTLIFTVGKAHQFANLRDWFQAIYEICLGQTQGPRFGSFVAIYGPLETAALIEAALDGQFV